MSKPLAFFQDLARRRYQREVVFVAQVGSLNYNLQTEDSDEDYEVYLLPTFNSYYNRQEVSVDTYVDGVDVKFKEVGLLANQLVKSNPNFLQLLFSKNVVYCAPELFWMFEQREELASANTPRLYDSLFGMAKNGESRVLGSRKKDALNGKALVQMSRTVHLVHRYVDTEFKDYETSLYLPDRLRRLCLHMKKGRSDKGTPLTEQEVDDLMKDVFRELKYFEPYYKEHPVNKEVLDRFSKQLEASVEEMFFQQYQK